MNGAKFPYAVLEREAIEPPAPPPAARGSNLPSRSVRTSRPRVLVLAQLPPPEHGASAVNRQVVSSRILSETFDLAVVPIAMSDDLAKLRKFDLTKIWRSLRLFGTVAGRLFGRPRPDAVYFTLSPAGWAFYRDLALVALIRLAGARCVFHLHGRGVAASIDRAPWRRHLYRFAFARASIITLGGTLRDDIKGLASEDRVFVVPNGIADTACTRHTRQGGDIPRGSDRPPRVLFLSNMLTEKGPLVLLEALSIVAAQGIRFEAQFVGAWRPPITEELFTARVHALGLRDRVTLPGPVYGDAKNRLFAETDLFVLPTYYRHEALPLAVIEAMMHGRAIITTRVGALPEIISDQESGELIEPGNVGTLASALEKLLTDPGLRDRYGRAARLKYESDLTAQRFEERLRDVLLQVSHNHA